MCWVDGVFGVVVVFCFEVVVAFVLVWELELYEVESVKECWAESVEVVDG